MREALRVAPWELDHYLVVRQTAIEPLVELRRIEVAHDLVRPQGARRAPGRSVAFALQLDDEPPRKVLCAQRQFPPQPLQPQLAAPPPTLMAPPPNPS